MAAHVLAGLTRALAPVAVSWCLATAVAGGAHAQGGERIVNFDSEIWVHPDATMTVRETITVVAQGQAIKRGIYRDFPTTYRDRFNNKVVVDFDVLSVQRDGKPEPHHTERIANGVRLYIGDKDVFIPKGQHVYTIDYRTNRQLGFFEGFDELYWNVTGNGWDFEIERAGARVHLPEGARILEHAGYTGSQGETKQDFRIDLRSDGILYETTRALGKHQGLTIAVSWPAGLVARPSEAEKLAYLMNDNSILIAGLIGLGLLTAYYLFVWVFVGQDPKPGAIVPQYDPPKGFSPAAARYVSRMGFDDKTFTAAIVSLAVKGAVTIKENLDKSYTLEKTGRENRLSPGESAVHRKLFSNGRRSIELKQANHKKLGAAQKALREWLRTEFEKIYFVRNTAYFVPGVVLSVAAMGLLVVAADDPAGAAFLCLWLSVWTVAVYFLGRQVWRGWQASLATGSLLGSGKALFATLFALPFFAGEVLGLGAFAESASLGAAVILVVLQLINLIFYHLLKAPTRLGRRMMDQIEGFADYLSVAEKDRMNFHNPPERTPELFERFLPYALALGVEQAWSEQFSDVLVQAGQAQGGRNGHYSPRWYSGRGFDGDFGSFASNLGGGFSGAIAAAATAPGSSSGSGGGGSSGGGGGGGGGGGW
jgi:Predicted membrane protein (DUF2207) C-terminal domain/Predicted membrane protein (DUF2207) N-terminal domain